MPSPAAQPEEAPKSIQKDLKWIRSEITELKSNVAVLENSPRRRFWAWVWKEKTWCTTITLALLTGAIFLGRFVFNSSLDAHINGRLNPLTTRVDLLKSTIDEMRGELRGLAARSKVAEAASATPTELATRLVVVREALQALKASGDSPPIGSLQTIQSRLVAMDGKAVGYWPLVFDLISYRSILITGISAPPDPKISVIKDSTMGKVQGGWFQLKGTISDTTFVNSWIEFSGDSPVSLKNIRFVGCVLVFHGLDIQAPSPPFQTLGRELLASSISDVKFPSGA